MTQVFDTSRILADTLDIPSSIPIDTDATRSGLAVYAPRPVGERIYLGHAMDWRTVPRPTEYIVTAQRLDRDWPGTKQAVTFAVERVGGIAPNGSRYVDLSVGFFHERECWEYLTSKKKIKVTVYDLLGKASTEIRQCLGIPEGATERATV